MALSLDNPIVSNDIESARSLGGNHPVWGLTGFQQEQIVVKKEAMTFRMDKTLHQNPGAKESLRTNLNIMHSVDPDAKIVVLSGAEVQAIGEFVEFQREFARVTNTPLSPAVQDMSNRLGTGGKWVKMGFKNLTTLERVNLDRVGGNKTGVRQFAAALNAPGGLEKLGEIIAADLFNDNQDRFSVQGGAGFNGQVLRAMVNVGNVLLSSGQVSGLDSWDPNSLTRKTRDTFMTQDPNRRWGGYLLGPAGSVSLNGNVLTKNEFAQRVIADLEQVLGPRNRKFFLLRNLRLVVDAKRRLKQGMTSGAAKIRAHLRGLGGVNALPVMVQGKVNALGWNPL